MHIYSMTQEELEDHVSKAKDLVISFLNEDGLLHPDADVSEIRKTVMVSIRSPGSISILYHKLFKKRANEVRMFISRLDAPLGCSKED